MASRATKTFTFDKDDEVWVKKLYAYAKKEKRTPGSQLMLILKDFFERQKLIDALHKV